jgi:hypothetical protein
MHLLYFLGGHVNFPHTKERMLYHAPSVVPGRPRHLHYSLGGHVISRKRKNIDVIPALPRRPRMPRHLLVSTQAFGQGCFPACGRREAACDHYAFLSA